MSNNPNEGFEKYDDESVLERMERPLDHPKRFSRRAVDSSVVNAEMVAAAVVALLDKKVKTSELNIAQHINLQFRPNDSVHEVFHKVRAAIQEALYLGFIYENSGEYFLEEKKPVVMPEGPPIPNFL